MSLLSSIAVYFSGEDTPRLIGHLTMHGQRPVFAYDPTWMANGLPLSPVEMPLEGSHATRLYYGNHRSSHYLCGLLADSLPDGWGQLLMDRFFRQHLKKLPHEVTVLDRFAYIGKHAMGALTFEPEYTQESEQHYLDMLTLAQENQAVLLGKDTDIIEQLMYIGGSPQGARPKALVYYDEHSCTVSTQPSQMHDEPWLVKFPAQGEDKGVCLLEHIYAEYVRKAGIVMLPSAYFDIHHEYGAFGVKRFDRKKSQRIHIHTLAGLLDTDFRIPTLDYTQLLRCVRMMTRSQQQVEQAYRQVVFNVIFNNKDDHSKNFSFVMDLSGKWSLSPAYDITFNTGINGYHQMDICGEAKAPTREHLLQLAKVVDVERKFAIEVIDNTIALAQDMIKEVKAYPLNKELVQMLIQVVSNNLKRVIEV